MRTFIGFAAMSCLALGLAVTIGIVGALGRRR